jgi:gas vesicle protein GvpO/gas vesicle protein GvpG
MFVLDSLLLAPGRAVLFLLEELAKKAQEDWLNDDSVKQELQEIYAMFEAGTLSTGEFEARELNLITRLQQIAAAKLGQLPPPAAGASIDLPLVEAGYSIAPLMPADISAAPPIIETCPVDPVVPLQPAAPPPRASLAEQLRDEENLRRVTEWRRAKTESARPAPATVAPPPRTFIPAAIEGPAAEPPLPPAIVSARPPAGTSSSARAAMTIPQVIDSAVRGLAMLKLKVSTVTSVSREDSGWRVIAELVERRSVPDTSDLLGVYELRLDEAGSILRYERTRMRRRADLTR